MKAPLLVLTCAFLTLVSSCSRKPATPATQITGTIEYRMPVNFDSDATLELRLTDVSGDAAKEVATTKVTGLKSLPYQYVLAYDAGQIDTAHRYMVDARISIDNTLRFSTDSAFAVLTQGNNTKRNITVIAIGENDLSLVHDLNPQPDASVFQGELRRDADVSLYKVGIRDGSIVWLEEDRSNGTPQALHARYEFKGALIMRYVDTSPLEVNFDERGRPTGLVRNGKALKLGEQTKTVNEVRNHAELLRSHALAARESQSHRQATGG